MMRKLEFNIRLITLFGNSTVLGCMIALLPIRYAQQTNHNLVTPLYKNVLQVVYTVSVVSLTLGILCVAVCLYAHVLQKKILAENHYKKLYNKAKIDASADDKKLKQMPKAYRYAEYAAYSLLSISILGFASYLVVS